MNDITRGRLRQIEDEIEELEQADDVSVEEFGGIEKALEDMDKVLS